MRKPNTMIQIASYHFFFGDESSLRPFHLLSRQFRFPQQKYIGVLELDYAYRNIPDELGLLVDICFKGEAAPCQGPIDYLHQLEPELWEHWKDGIFHLRAAQYLTTPFQKALDALGIPRCNQLSY